MRRRLLIVVIFLLAGAVVNVAVAWGFDTWNRVRVEKILQISAQPRGHGVYVPDEDRTPIDLDSYAVGWPTDALGRTFTWDAPQLRWVLRPIWPGLIVNTLFYATVLWLLICGPFVLRRFIRVRRGLCPACAYPRGESDVCSECGLALQQRQLKVAGP